MNPSLSSPTNHLSLSSETSPFNSTQNVLPVLKGSVFPETLSHFFL